MSLIIILGWPKTSFVIFFHNILWNELFGQLNICVYTCVQGFSGGSVVKNSQVLSAGWEDPLEVKIANYSSILAWEIPWTEESGGLQSMGSQRVGCN